MSKIGLVGPSFQERSLPFDAQRTINFYPVLDQNGKEISSLYGTPGTQVFASLGVGPIRGGFTTALGRVFICSSNYVYELFVDGTNVIRGTLQTVTSIVLMEENGLQLAVCDGSSLFTYTYSTNVFAQVTSANVPNPAASITFIDGYFVVNKGGTGQFNISALYDGTSWAALDFATAESSPDNLSRVLNAIGQLWLFGTSTTEIWYDTGAQAFPFQRISGGKMEMGIYAPYSAIALDNTVFWIGQNKEGYGIVYRASGFTPQRVSTSFEERMIQSAPNPLTLRSDSYQEDGHTFLRITGGGMSTALVYDLTTQLWHERAFLDTAGNYELPRGALAFYAFGKQLLGSRLDGTIYVQSLSYFSDAEVPLVADRIYTHLSDEGKRIRYNTLEIGVESGVGLQTGQGSAPLISMRLSQDGARTWSDWYTAPMGRVGTYQTRVQFRRLGVSDIQTFNIRITDPVKRCITGSYLS